MERWREYFHGSGEDIWTVIEQAIDVARSDFPDQLRSRRDGFTERMYAPHRIWHSKSEDDDLLPAGGMDEASGGGRLSEDDDEEYEDEEDEERGEGQGQEGQSSDDGEKEVGVRCSNDDEGNAQGVREVIPIDISDNDEEDEGAAAGRELSHDDAYGDAAEALNDAMESYKLLLSDINSIKHSIKSVNQPEAEVIDLLDRLKELNISVEALKETNIGKSVNFYRKHPSMVVRNKAREIVRSWKDLVDDWMTSVRDASASAREEGIPAERDDEVGLPSPPLDEGGLLAAGDVEMSEIFNFTDDDLSAGSGPSPPTDGLSYFGTVLDKKSTRSDRADHHHNGTTAQFSGSPRRDQNGRGQKGVARVLRVDKHRPMNVDNNKPDQNARSGAKGASSATTTRKVPAAPASDGRPSNGSTGMNNMTRRPTGGNGSTVGSRPHGSDDEVLRKSDTRPTPNLGGRPREDAVKPGPSTKFKPDIGDVSDDVNEKLEASKRRLHSNYMRHDLAKKQRTVQQLDLTELPKGGPKAQRPGQSRGWTNGRK